MPWFKPKTNVRLNKKRYVRGVAVELDSATAKLNDNFVPCDAPKSAPVAAPVSKPVEAKAATGAPKSEAPAPKKV